MTGSAAPARTGPAGIAPAAGVPGGRLAAAALLAALLVAPPALSDGATCAPDPETADGTGAVCIGPLSFVCPGARPDRLEATFLRGETARVEIVHGERRLAAEAAVSASGARYEGADGLVFWTKGDGASLVLPDGSRHACTLAAEDGPQE